MDVVVVERVRVIAQALTACVGVYGVLVLVAWVRTTIQRHVYNLIFGLYDAGDGEGVASRLHATTLQSFIPLATALGWYREALARVEKVSPQLFDPSALLTLKVHQLNRINLAETLCELGQEDLAARLLAAPIDDEFLDCGRRSALAWTLVTLGRSTEALETLKPVKPAVLLKYECEYWMTLAFVERSLMKLDDCEAALHSASKVATRASSQRNLKFAWAELHRARGDVSRALAHYDAGAKHVWRWQGGSGLLNWGTLLAQLGRHHEARAAWTQCLEQDPQSLAAIEAKRLLNSSGSAPSAAAP